MYSVIDYPERCNTLFRGYVEKFVKIKQENSAFEGTPEEYASRVEEEYKKIGMNITLDPAKCKFTSGKRQIAKISLNSLWGKMAMRPNLPHINLLRPMESF